MKTIVLMYHGLFEDQRDLEKSISQEDRPYAVLRENFRRQLSLIKQAQANNPDTQIVLTFDDGHISNFSMALPDLQAAGLGAWFFITTDFMRAREHFCRPEHLAAMHEAGMIIGSHGVSHSFLDRDLAEQALRREFSDSRLALEAAISSPVSSISFPGGRYSEDSVKLARDCGYRHLFGSRVGVNKALEDKGREPIRRVAIRKSTSDTEFQKIISADMAYYSTIAAKQSLKSGLRKLLGNRLYHGLYKSVAG
ncbi:MAG: polysaccharide deacetylase family protein [Gammaproteobacteria bacterium]|nr:polysaccharide deacetylase family protein [Gammaproteobacteria bacterium]